MANNQQIPEVAFLHNFPDDVQDIEAYVAELQRKQKQWMTPIQKWSLALVAAIAILIALHTFVHKT
jgi:hypothetical protein